MENFHSGDGESHTSPLMKWYDASASSSTRFSKRHIVGCGKLHMVWALFLCEKKENYQMGKKEVYLLETLAKSPTEPTHYGYLERYPKVVDDVDSIHQRVSRGKTTFSSHQGLSKLSSEKGVSHLAV